MRPCADEASFVSAPVGRWIAAGTSLLWCASPTLCGSTGWGRPTEAETRKVVRLFGAFQRLAPRFDVLLDGSAIEKVEGPSLLLIMEWTRSHFEELRRRVRRRVGVIGGGLPAVTLSGISPSLGGPGPVTLVRDAREGFRELSPEGGDALCDEVTELVNGARGLVPLLQALRPLLGARRGRLSLAEAAAELGRSPRSLQRELRAAGRSYRDEVQEARFHVAERLLAGDDKLAAVAAQLELTEAGLTGLVRAFTGLTPGEFRRRQR